jgi:hypothetical protein
MKNRTITLVVLILTLALCLNSCKNANKSSENNLENDSAEIQKEQAVYASDVIPFFDNWKLILGDGSNAGIVHDFENKDFFYTTNDGKDDWVVFKAPNGGDTHGTSNNTRTELAQIKKWYPETADDKLTATLKVMNVSSTGDARVAATHAVVVGQIHQPFGGMIFLL